MSHAFPCRLQSGNLPCRTMRSRTASGTWLALLALMSVGAADRLDAQCPSQTLTNHQGGGQVACPCFIPNEQAGVVFQAPAGDYPLEVLRVGVGWGSWLGGSPSTLEYGLHVYEGGLPDPGAPIFTLEGPVLADGVINAFDLEPLPGEIVVDSGPFTVTIQFLNQSYGNLYQPAVVHDGLGCIPGRNVVYAIPGGWSDACPLGVSGNWVFFVVYRPCAGATGVTEPHLLVSTPVTLLPPQPNPSNGDATFEFALAAEGPVMLSLFDVSGRRIRTLADEILPAGQHLARWDGRTDDGRRAGPGVYFARLVAGRHAASRTVLVQR